MLPNTRIAFCFFHFMTENKSHKQHCECKKAAMFPMLFLYLHFLRKQKCGFAQH